MGEPRVFKTRWFQRFARKERIRDAVLLDAKEAAHHVLRLTEKQVAQLVEQGDFLEVSERDQETSK
jgi:hypothetical protein